MQVERKIVVAISNKSTPLPAPPSLAGPRFDSDIKDGKCNRNLSGFYDLVSVESYVTLFSIKFDIQGLRNNFDNVI
ncbi:MAG: hypothetical protein JRN20_20875 [Nitrososphaerota archaeon]|nr:hypothetical protein [Nitrososphaerota archaeon]